MYTGVPAVRSGQCSPTPLDIARANFMLRGNFMWLDGLPERVGWLSPARWASSSVKVTVGSSLWPWREKSIAQRSLVHSTIAVVVDGGLAHERGEDPRADDRLALDDVDVGHRRERADAQLAAGEDLDDGLADAGDVREQARAGHDLADGQRVGHGPDGCHGRRGDGGAIGGRRDGRGHALSFRGSEGWDGRRARRAGRRRARSARLSWMWSDCSWLDDEPQRLGREQLLEPFDGFEVADDQLVQHAADGGAGLATVLAAADGPQHLGDVGDDAPVGLVLVEDAEATTSGAVVVVVIVMPPCLAMLAAGWDVWWSGRVARDLRAPSASRAPSSDATACPWRSAPSATSINPGVERVVLNVRTGSPSRHRRRR